MDNFVLQMYPLVNLGKTYHLQGDIAKSLEHFNKGLFLAQKLNNKRIMAAAYDGLGLVSQSQENFNEALNYFLNGFELLEEIKLTGFHDYVLLVFRLGLLYVQIGNREAALNFHKKLSMLPSQDNVLYVAPYCDSVEAMILNMSNKIEDKVLAKNIFKSIYSDPKSTFQQKTRAMVQLCDILINEEKQTKEIHLSKELKELINELTKLTEFTPPEFSDALVLQSQIQLIEGKIDQALATLGKAKSITEENGLTSLNTIVIKEREVIHKELSKWQTLINSNAPVSERIQQTRVENYLKEVIKLMQTREDY